MFTKKQGQVIECYKKERPKVLVCEGAKRAGKTHVLNYIFLANIAKHKDKGLSFILGGTTQASLRRNVLNDLEKILGKELRLDKSNSVNIFGNKVYCFDGADVSSFKKVRGFTAAGAFLNEGTTLHDSFIKEVMSRCSYPDSRILIDTNPENPAHSIKKDYIDKSGQRLHDGRLNIISFNFTLFDNDKLDPVYIESIVAATPTGIFTDRDILGKWCLAEGVIYSDFKPEISVISSIDDVVFKEYFCGVDWGYSHSGVIVVMGEDIDGNIYLIKEYAEKYKDIEYWLEVAEDIKEQYGNIHFFCDSARPEYVAKFRQNGIKAFNANKSVMAGIGAVARLFKQNKFFIYDASQIVEELNLYVWNKSTGEPVKANDDVLDAVRYAVYSRNKNRMKIISKGVLGL